MSQITIKVTAEELFAGNMSADADLSVTFDLTPPERPTRDYPGHPGTVELVDWKVDKIHIYDANGEQIQNPLSWGEFVPAIDKWVNDNDQSLIEQACEEDAERSDPYNYF